MHVRLPDDDRACLLQVRDDGRILLGTSIPHGEAPDRHRDARHGDVALTATASP
jgi:hypothetical protein